MKLISYRPINQELASPFDRLHSLRDLFDSAFALAAGGTGAPAAVWNPALDVYESESSLFVEVELPGMKKEDIDISLEEDVLTISGQRSQEKEDRSGESLRSERAFGQFRRSFTLPLAVQSDAVKATYLDGVLRIELPKAEEAKPRKIEVGVD
jgi:HSP20 family protein